MIYSIRSIAALRLIFKISVKIFCSYRTRSSCSRTSAARGLYSSRLVIRPAAVQGPIYVRCTYDYDPNALRLQKLKIPCDVQLVVCTEHCANLEVLSSFNIPLLLQSARREFTCVRIRAFSNVLSLVLYSLVC